MHWFPRWFGRGKAAIGVVHVAPLPGSPRSALGFEAVRARALRDAATYLRGGIDGLIVENFGDAPFPRGASPPHVAAFLTRIAAEVKALAKSRPVGINVLRNDGCAALAVAAAADCDFVRINVLTGAAVTDQGLIESDAAAVLRYRKAIGADVRIFADFRVKHANALRVDSLEVELDELIGRALADAVLVTGAATGQSPDPAEVEAIRAAAGGTPVLVASGATPGNVAALAPHADGFLVGTAMERGGRTGAPVDLARVRAFLARLRRA